MSLSLTRLAAVAALVVLSACGTMRVHALPVGPGGAHSTFAPLQYAAEQAGYRAWIGKDGTHVEVDAVSSLHYVVFGNRYSMQVLVDDKKVPAAELETKLEATRRLGDELWKKAMDARAATGTVILGG